MTSVTGAKPAQARAAAPTLEAVAALAGVSRATVSRVVNGSSTVTPSSADAVRAAIAQLGYVPNRAARSLASQQSHAIALVVPEDTTRFFGDVYFASIVAGINRRLERSDYLLNLMIASKGPEAKMLRYLAGGVVDGVVVVSHHTSDMFVREIGDMLPMVFGGRPAFDDLKGYVVDVDNVAGAATATQHLIDRGRRRIATITGPMSMQSGMDRLEGWRTTVEKAGLEPGPVVHGDYTMLSGSRAARELLAQGDEFDAVFVASDLMASGAQPVFLDRGLRVPEDIAMVGYDDSPSAVRCDVPLTTVRQPSEAMGEEMADILLSVLAGDMSKPQETLLPTALVERSST
ncbi:LacI family transcriptional regulator [Demequina sp. B12]|uniref:LacI family DNA-binding transcriptional regulator n=1 Tax=Demequina sp. B12 TaxID=2992757 RepID=UPI00237B724B|nr:LacI family DNA-binding transcriptional regulator [Demequina sp. B12]MDE0573925.1 LacI family transcriptional regulator [Demequina sp. B12]